MGLNSSKALVLEDGIETEFNVVERAWRSDDVVAEAATGMTQIALVPTLMSDDDQEIRIITHPMEDPLRLAGCTTKLEIRLVSDRKNRDQVFDLSGKTPIEISRFISTSIGTYGNQFRVVHNYKAKGKKNWVAKAQSYTFLIETKKPSFILWADVIAGLGERNMAKVPVLLVENTKKSNTYDVHVLFPTMPVATNRRVYFQFATDIDTDMGGADDITVMVEERQRRFDGRMSSMAGKLREETPRDGVEMVIMDRKSRRSTHYSDSGEEDGFEDVDF